MLRFKDEAVHRGALPQAAAAMAATPAWRRSHDGMWHPHGAMQWSHDGVRQSHDSMLPRADHKPLAAHGAQGAEDARPPAAGSLKNVGRGSGTPVAGRRQASVSDEQEAVVLRNQPDSPHPNGGSSLVRQRSYSADGGYAAAAQAQMGQGRRSTYLNIKPPDVGTQWAQQAAAWRRPPLSPLSQPRELPFPQYRAPMLPPVERPQLYPAEQLGDSPLDEDNNSPNNAHRRQLPEYKVMTPRSQAAAAPNSLDRKPRRESASDPLEALKLRRLRLLLRRSDDGNERGQNRQSDTSFAHQAGVQRTLPSEPALPCMQPAGGSGIPKGVRLSGGLVQPSRAPLRQRSYSADAVGTLVTKASLLSGNWLEDLHPEPRSANSRGNATPAFTAEERYALVSRIPRFACFSWLRLSEPYSAGVCLMHESISIFFLHAMYRQQAFVEMHMAAHANRMRALGMSSEVPDQRPSRAVERSSGSGRHPSRGSLDRPPPLNARGCSLPEMPTLQREAAAAAFQSQISAVSSDYALDAVAESEFVLP